MNVMTAPKMTVDEFLAWAEGKPGKYELFGGVVQQMSPEMAEHVLVKGAVWGALKAAIASAKLPCRAYSDGMTVRIDESRAFVPDALVHGSRVILRKTVEIRDPLIVVEVLSPSTASRDVATKLAGYFTLPSIHHYLIVDVEETSVVHHRRGSANVVETSVVKDGELVLDPPGLHLNVADFFEDLQ